VTNLLVRFNDADWQSAFGRHDPFCQQTKQQLDWTCNNDKVHLASV